MGVWLGSYSYSPDNGMDYMWGWTDGSEYNYQNFAINNEINRKR
jgi:hypothetical protein